MSALGVSSMSFPANSLGLRPTHDFVKSPLPLGVGPSHIGRKPAETSVTPPVAPLTDVNAGGGDPTKMPKIRRFGAGVAG
jgi:hypothetical protein